MSANLQRLAQASPGTARFPFALALDELSGERARGCVPIGGIAENQLAAIPQVMLEVFSPEECARIVTRCEAEPLHAGQVVQERENYRRANAAWIPPFDDTRWIYERMAAMVVSINRWYRYELYGFLEPLHFVRYDEGGKFDWHLDCGGDRTCTRKLSVTVQLSSPQDYSGGGLEFCPQGELHRSRHHGAATVFPSVLAHRVTPVERGVRRAIVAWIHGPSFR